jgi:hypothetical protein
MEKSQYSVDKTAQRRGQKDERRVDDTHNHNYATCAASACCVWPTMPTVQAGRARRVLSGHVFGARRLPLVDAKVGNVERRAGVHVVRAELVA